MQHVVVQDKEDAGIWTALGDAYKKRGNYQSAIKAYKEAIQLKPSDDFAQIQVNFFLKVLQSSFLLVPSNAVTACTYFMLLCLYFHFKTSFHVT